MDDEPIDSEPFFMHEPNSILLNDLLERMPDASDSEFNELSIQFIRELDPSWKPPSVFKRFFRRLYTVYWRVLWLKLSHWFSQ